MSRLQGEMLGVCMRLMPLEKKQLRIQAISLFYLTDELRIASLLRYHLIT